MQKYFKKAPKFTESNTNDSHPVHDVPSSSTLQVQNLQDQSPEWEHCLEFDPSKRKPISEFHPDVQNLVRRLYLLRGPTQPRNSEYPITLLSQKPRSFLESWYNNNFNWLEYSEENDSVHCIPCYLFNNESNSAKQIFAEKKGFEGWNKKGKLKIHVGGHNSDHVNAVKKCEALMNKKQSIESSFKKQSDQKKANYLVRIKASLTSAKYLFRGGLAFRAHDESDNSSYRGNFLEILEVLWLNNEEIGKVVLKKAPKNHKMTSPDIQKELVNECAIETINKIVNEIGDNTFTVLVDESSDSGEKEQMDVVARYIDDKGFVVERFIGIVHVKETSAISLKNALETLLCGYKLFMSKIRGQGYDGASNMCCRFGGLKALIQKDNPNAYYVHYFAHQLQLALIEMRREHPM